MPLDSTLRKMDEGAARRFRRVRGQRIVGSDFGSNDIGSTPNIPGTCRHQIIPR
jgi:hypothetical protein